MTTTIDIDALLGEAQDRPLTYRGTTFNLPGELPAEALAPFLTDEFSLLELIAEVVGSLTDEDEWVEVAFNTLKSRPTIPKDLLTAAAEALRVLLGEQYDAFVALKPSVPAYLLIAQHITQAYSVSLADFFGLGESSESDGETSSPTSSAGTDWTPLESGADPELPASSESDASAP
jgi:hypothetical protein